MVAAALTDDTHRVLVTQRPEGAHLAGTWEFPGGKKQEGEGDADALVRELREELGIESTVGDLVAEVEHPYEDFVVHLRLYRARIVRGVPRPLQVADLRWVEVGELPALDMPPADAPLIDALTLQRGR